MTRTDLHQLVDALPEDAIDEAALLLSRAADPTLRRLISSPLDDELESAEEQYDAETAWAAHQRGEGISLAQLCSELDPE